MDNAKPESDYIAIDAGIVSTDYVKSLGVPVGAVREFVRRLIASDEQIVEHVESLGMDIPHVWGFLRQLGNRHGLGGEIESSVLGSLLRGLADGAGKEQGSQLTTPAQPKRRRRESKSDAKAKRAKRKEREADDRRLSEAWQGGTGSFRTLDELAKEMGMTKPEVRRGLDRHRKRLERTGKR